MPWVLVAVDDYTLGAVMDEARVKSLDGGSEFALLTPKISTWGDESEGNGESGYLNTLGDRIALLATEGIKINHEWLPGDNLAEEIIEAGRRHGAEGIVIAHHNPSPAIPNPEAFDDRLRNELGVALEVISIE